MNTYILHHISSGAYINSGGSHVTRYENKRGWFDYLVNPSYLFSHRTTRYTKENFQDHIHSHDFYEVIFYVGGDVQYINEDQVISPDSGDAILTAPNRMHAAKLKNASTYERFVLQFDTDILAFFGENSLLSFTSSDPDRCFISPDDSMRQRMMDLLVAIEASLQEDSKNSNLIALSYTIQLFDLLCRSSDDTRESDETMPENIHRIKQYIDERIFEISSATEVAEHFYYSREYMSRLFKRYFNTTISDYIKKRKINESKKILAAGGSVTDACYDSGFRNMSSYIKAFSSICGITPSKYRKASVNRK